MRYTHIYTLSSVNPCVLQHQQQRRRVHKPRASHTVARLIKIPRAPANTAGGEYYTTGEDCNHCCL